MQTETFNVAGMSCQHCVKSVTQALAPLRGVQGVSVSLADNQVTITYAPAEISLEQCRQAVRDIGFDTP
ncbi:MAG TPA: cation transporter [Burkholderiaceae bacterium]|nr:cation transporter [Burkholderiaceae bacterium]